MTIDRTKLDAIHKRGEIARKLVLEIKPDATFRHYNNRNGFMSLEGLTINDCCDVCSELDQAFRDAGDLEAANLIHEIPVLVFATLPREQIPEFLKRWNEATE